MMILQIYILQIYAISLFLRLMKRATEHIFRLLVVLIYVLAYMGFGIHTCHDDGSRHLVWLMGDTSCEAIHHHSHDADHDHHHDGHCCSTQVFVVTDAQDSDTGADRTAGTPEAGLPAIVETPCFASLQAVHAPFFASDTPPPIAPPTLSLLSVWLV